MCWGCEMKQNGFILIVSLIFLLLMTVLAIAMFGGFTIGETMSGNNREKNRAIDGAQTALNAAGYRIQWQPNSVYTGNWNTGVTCVPTTPQPTVCSNDISAAMGQSPTTLPWTFAMSSNPTNGQGVYAVSPHYYIKYLTSYGSGTTLDYALYQVTASSSGGNSAAVSVIQAVIQVHALSSYAGGA